MIKAAIQAVKSVEREIDKATRLRGPEQTKEAASLMNRVYALQETLPVETVAEPVGMAEGTEDAM